MAKKFSETKEGRISDLKWKHITSVKMGYPVDLNACLAKVLDIVVEGTRFQKDVEAIKTARQIKRRKK